MSFFGDFLDDFRERVEEYVRDVLVVLNVEELRKRQKILFLRGIFLDCVFVMMKEEENELVEEEDDEEDFDEEDDVEFEFVFVKGFQEFIFYYICVGNYIKVVDFINEVMLNSVVFLCNNLLCIF